MSDKPNARGEKNKTYQLRVSQITALNPPPLNDAPGEDEASASTHNVSSTADAGSSKASVRKLKGPIKRALPKFASSDEDDVTSADKKRGGQQIGMRMDEPKPSKRFRLTNHPERTTVTRSKNANSKQKTGAQATDPTERSDVSKGKEKATEGSHSGDDSINFEELEAMVD